MYFFKKAVYGLTLIGMFHLSYTAPDPQPITVKIDLASTVGGVGTEGIEKGVAAVVKGVIAGTKDGISDKENGIGSVINSALSSVRNSVTEKNFADDIAMIGATVGRSAGHGLGAGVSAFEGEYREFAVPTLQRLSLESIGAFFNMRNALQLSGPVALGIACTLSVSYGVPLVFKALENYIFKPRPQVLLAYARVGRWDRIKQWYAEKTKPIAMVFNPLIKERLDEIVHKASYVLQNRSKHKKMTFDNILLVGPPGTGKTLFVQLLAEKTNMDLMPITAASLLQKDAGIAYLNQMIALANSSAYGVIIFIDEADALFVNRDQLPVESEHYKVLNHFLALTGDGSNRVIIVAATNHSHVLDKAMDRRFQDRIDMELPDLNTRLELVRLYVTTVLHNKNEFEAAFVEHAQTMFTDTLIDSMAHATEGLSHAEIKDLVHAIGKKGCISGNGIITQEHIDAAIAQALEKRKKFDADHVRTHQVV